MRIQRFPGPVFDDFLVARGKLWGLFEDATAKVGWEAYPLRVAGITGTNESYEYSVLW